MDCLAPDAVRAQRDAGVGAGQRGDVGSGGAAVPVLGRAAAGRRGRRVSRGGEGAARGGRSREGGHVGQRVGRGLGLVLGRVGDALRHPGAVVVAVGVVLVVGDVEEEALRLLDVRRGQRLGHAADVLPGAVAAVEVEADVRVRLQRRDRVSHVPDPGGVGDAGEVGRVRGAAVAGKVRQRVGFLEHHRLGVAEGAADGVDPGVVVGVGRRSAGRVLGAVAAGDVVGDEDRDRVLQPGGGQREPDLPGDGGVGLLRALVAGLGRLRGGLAVEPDRGRHRLHGGDQARVLQLAALDQLQDLLDRALGGRRHVEAGVRGERVACGRLGRRGGEARHECEGGGAHDECAQTGEMPPEGTTLHIGS